MSVNNVSWADLPAELREEIFSYCPSQDIIESLGFIDKLCHASALKTCQKKLRMRMKLAVRCFFDTVCGLAGGNNGNEQMKITLQNLKVKLDGGVKNFQTKLSHVDTIGKMANAYKNILNDLFDSLYETVACEIEDEDVLWERGYPPPDKFPAKERQRFIELIYIQKKINKFRFYDIQPDDDAETQEMAKMLQSVSYDRRIGEMNQALSQALKIRKFEKIFQIVQLIPNNIYVSNQRDMSALLAQSKTQVLSIKDSEYVQKIIQITIDANLK